MRSALWLALALSLLAGPASLAAADGTLKVGVARLPAALDPATALDGPIPLIARQVYDTLVQYTESGSDIEPGLAVQWSASRDGLVWSFRLREGVRFHDGTALAAQHVVESLSREVFPSNAKAPVASVAGKLLRGAPGVIRQIRAKDARTVEVILSQPYAPLVSVLAHPAFSIVLPAAGSDGQWLGTGPFSVAEVSGSRIVLEAVPGHWRRGPLLERIVLTAAPEEARAEAAVTARELDVVFPSAAPIRPERALSVPGWRVGYLALETEKSPFDRVKARRAISAALDPVPIALALGRAAAPLGTFLPKVAGGGGRPAPSLLGAEPERAKKLLAEAGVAPGASVSMIAADLDPAVDRLKLAGAIAGSLKAAGLVVSVRKEPWESVRTLAETGEQQMVLAEARMEAGDPHFSLYPLSASEGAVKGPGAVNYSFYRNKQLDDVLIRASQLSFRPERDRLYARAQSVLAEELPWIPIYVRLHWVVMRAEVRDLRPHPSGYPRLDRAWIDQGTGIPPAAGAPAR